MKNGKYIIKKLSKPSKTLNTLFKNNKTIKNAKYTTQKLPKSLKMLNTLWKNDQNH